jgi:hypothetical protein
LRGQLRSLTIVTPLEAKGVSLYGIQQPPTRQLLFSPVWFAQIDLDQHSTEFRELGEINPAVRDFPRSTRLGYPPLLTENGHPGGCQRGQSLAASIDTALSRPDTRSGRGTMPDLPGNIRLGAPESRISCTAHLLYAAMLTNDGVTYPLPASQSS